MGDTNFAKRLGKRRKERTPGPDAGGSVPRPAGGPNWSRTLGPRSTNRPNAAGAKGGTSSVPRSIAPAIVSGQAGRGGASAAKESGPGLAGVAGAACSASPVCLQLAAAIDDMKEALPRAALAADVYDAYDPERAAGLPPPSPPKGFVRVSDDPGAMRKLLPGLTDEQIKNLTHPDNSSYRAAVYKDESGKVFLVFRGTENKEGMKDWKENGLQGGGLQSEHYEKAKELAVLLESSQGRDKMEIVGHSKGGGMAAAAGIVTGAKTTTFNAAGVHPNTVPGFDPLKASGNVSSYVVDGEVLNWLQDNRGVVHAGVAAPFAMVGGALAGLGALAAVADKLPPSVGRRTPLPAVWHDSDKPAWYDPVKYRVTLHGMPKVREGIRERRSALEKDYEANGCVAQLGRR